MLVTEVVPHTLETTDAATDAGREWLRTRYRRDEPAYVRLNMITSLTGAASGADGTSDTLTSRVDRSVLGAIRRDADVVVVGAQSVRTEGYVVPKTAHLAVVTSSGRLDGHRLELDAEAAARVTLVVPEASADAIAERAGLPGVRVLTVAADERLDARAIVATLAAEGLPRIVCEGGPSLAGQFAEAGVIDEYCVTVAPTIDPADAPFLPVRARVDARVAGMLVDEAGFSYLRLRPQG
ncbi:dihydrofolate reductase family protein [Microbacterium immunditiarum]|uniref:Riboflavin biosynthesis pyrimidine reductase n=1 Tax=Microbacterium immunditiarum TaxID=337480 RepID=A0A7Y9GQ08_9MICO|nr:dihydrofolate reductase family protein [Microbacterium immunditiarum]NYE20444.1 riboflavin biosynthesis pyrimidine reductase [Microbacterium immunditiarum]